MTSRWALALLVVLLLTASACSRLASLFGDSSSDASSTYPAPPRDTPEEIKAIWETWNTLVNEHVDRGAIDRDKLKEAAIQGMLKELDDPFTSYLDPETYRLESGGFSGDFEGIGAEVTFTNNRPIIVAPLPDSPAKAAGIRPGDVILSIDGVTTEGKTLQDAILRIRGPKGTAVTLTIRHLLESETVEVTIIRGVISLQSVTSNVMEGDLGYVRLAAFNGNSNDDLLQVLKEMQGQRVAGIVLDLRNNPGGLVSAVVDVASNFLGEGLVLYEVDGQGRRTDLKVKGNPLMPDVPLVVLVNRFSASGSEVLAGALQDHGRAIVVGTRTFGKGSVNLLRSLSDGGGLYFTYAHWYTPNGRLIQGQGLDPDVEVPGNPGPKGDPQLDQAVALLKERMPVAAP